VASLQAIRGAEIVNVQFATDAHHFPGVRTLAVLQQTSNGVSGRRGVTKPIMSEIFDALAAEATARQLDYFCFTNADIIFTQAAIDWIARSGKDAYILSRQDFDGTTGKSTGMELAGTDVFAVSTAWWSRHRSRFRPYIAAEGIWDNVYTAVCCATPMRCSRTGAARPARGASSGDAVAAVRPYAHAGRVRRRCQPGCSTGSAARSARAGTDGAEEAALARTIFVEPHTRHSRGAGRPRPEGSARYRWWFWRAGAGWPIRRAGLQTRPCERPHLNRRYNAATDDTALVG
jgi:hypothetical protein